MAQDRYPLLRLPPFQHDPAHLAQADFKSQDATARWLHVDADDALVDEEGGDVDADDDDGGLASPWAKSRGLTLTQLSSAAGWVHQELVSNRVVFVHCQMGISRSPSIATGALALHLNTSVVDAFRRLKSTRGIACPNPFFRRLLAAFQDQMLSAKGLATCEEDTEAAVQLLTQIAEGPRRFEGISSKNFDGSVLWCPTVPTVSIEGYFELLPAMGGSRPPGEVLDEYRAAVARYEVERETAAPQEQNLQFGDDMTDEEWLASLE
jgi:hypothetical protein